MSSERTFTANEVIQIANETSDSFGNLYRLDFIDRIRHEAEPDGAGHRPLAVVSYDGIPFVKCSCDHDGKPQSAVWLREHWQGTEDEGIAAIKAVVAQQAAAAKEQS